MPDDDLNGTGETWDQYVARVNAMPPHEKCSEVWTLATVWDGDWGWFWETVHGHLPMDEFEKKRAEYYDGCRRQLAEAFGEEFRGCM